MKKLLFNLRALMLLLLMMVGVSSAWAETKTGTITFGTNNVKINAASVNGNDNLGNSWTISTVGTSSFTANSDYYQVGSSKNPATSITFTTSLPSNQTISAFSAKFGGFSSTAGTVKLKVGDKEVGSGSLSETTDVTVKTSDSFAGVTGAKLTVTVTGISKGVKCYYISYTYGEDGGSITPDAPTISSIAVNTAPTKVTYTEGEKFSPAGLVITKTMSDGNTGDVAYAGNESAFTFNPSLETALTTSDVSVTITYGGKSCNQTITVNELPTHTAQFFVNGKIDNGNNRIVKEGESITFPSVPEVDGVVFKGWTTAAIDGTQDNAPDFVNTATETMGENDVTYYAVFANANAGSESLSETVGFENSEGYPRGTTYNSGSYTTGSTGSKWQINYGAFSTNDAIVGNQSAQFRIYTTGGGYGQLKNTVAYAKDISKVEFSAKTANTNGQVKVSYSTNGSSWTDITTKSLTTTTTEYSVAVPVSGVKYIKFTAAGSKPASGNYSIFVDNVKIYSVGSTTYSNYCTTVSASYTVTIETPEGGTISAKVGGSIVDSGTRLEAGTTVSLEPIADQDYTFSSWNVSSESGNIEVTDNSFVMPAEDVTISAVFQAVGAKQLPLSFEGYRESTDWTINADWSSDYKDSPTAYYKIYKENSIETPLMNFNGCVTAEIVLKMRKQGGVSGNSAILSVKFNDKELGTIKAENTTLTDYIFDIVDLPSGDGHLVFSVPEGTSENGVGIQAIMIEGSNKPAAPVITPASCVFEGQKEITIEKRGSAEVKIFYTTDGTDPTAKSSEYTAPFAINTTCTVKAVAICNDVASDAAIAEYTFLDLSNCDTYTWTAADAGFTDADIISELSFGDFLSAVLKKNEGGTNPKYYNSGTNVRLYGKNTMNISSNYNLVIKKVIMNYAIKTISTDQFTTSDGALSFDTENYIATWIGNSGNITFTNTNNSGYFALSKIVIYYELEKEPITIASSVGYATCVTNSALDFSTMGENLKAYKVKVNAKEGEVMLVPVTKVPADQAIVVKGDVTTHSVPVLKSTEETMADNDLKWSDSKVEVSTQYTHYVLAIRDEKACFAPVAVGSKIGVRKGYFVVKNSEAPTFRIAIESEEGNSTSLNTVETTYNADVVFNLTGQRVEKISKSGLYIVNGNKVVIK